MQNVFLSINVGTNSLRTALVSPSGDIVSIDQEPILLWKTPTVMEMSSDNIWQMVVRSVRAISFGTNFLCLANYSAHKSTKISLISCTSQKFSF